MTPAILLIILNSFVFISFMVWLSFLTYYVRKLTKRNEELKRKLHSTDHDIKTLHSNQKELQSLIKEIRKDLLVYGEIKKSRTKAISFERPEKD